MVKIQLDKVVLSIAYTNKMWYDINQMKQDTHVSFYNLQFYFLEEDNITN